MKTVTVDQMRIMDTYAPLYGKDEQTLMENAASAIVQEAISYGRILFFCGTGNNGGDGFAAARLLSRLGKCVTVVFDASPDRLRGAAKENFLRLQKTDVRVISFADLSGDTDFDLLIDALFGTGFHGEVRGTFREMISYINSSSAPVLSVDIPSGVNGDSGRVDSLAVRAQKTVTFGFPKPGLYQYPGRAYAGSVTVKDIGIPAECVNATDFYITATDTEAAKRLLPPISPEAHKGDMGRVMLIAGSEGMAGAAYLATQAAVNSGAGLVTLACPACIKDVEMVKLNEAMVLPLPDRNGSLSALGTDRFTQEVTRMDAVGMGCGLRNTADVSALVRTLLSLGTPAVLDADALNALCDNPDALTDTPTVITPHPAEFSRLSERSLEEISANRLDAAREFAMRYRVTVVLKGASTVVAAPDGQCALNLSGNPGMATGGAGDVLTGMITALLGSGLSPYDAARLGVYAHGLAGDLARRKTGTRGLTAGAILAHIGNSFLYLEEGNKQ